MRIGTGYDLHRLVDDRELILGGVKIPYEKGLFGHSDADVLIHAIIDSLLGAMGEKDIGTHFPDTDVSFKNISSVLLLQKTMQIMQNNGYKIVNIDTNIICQKPKLMPFIDKMKENLAPLLNIDESALSIKAKTNEGVDATGMGEAIAAQCVCLIEKV
ncbi:TPA: 2-C-methyl-D-erythritol 2,4-cyclodiphosphate synthase [Candidatus Galligastranaerophilus intestinavium]|uniref:2-C-methyl-D-erythritol 2,4-cyclodiphosphate synthase n=1 Tax=Candidatus Galligastranaerophilus intestinavium TaxID=2840836 RepID=A0A9D1FIL9_9BACT|nr:2-C-methyl-D-erythritol 2,4-cyclodiphosphate synthase [Candidatus Galligastranaerophilus intestinavium]